MQKIIRFTTNQNLGLFKTNKEIFNFLIKHFGTDLKDWYNDLKKTFPQKYTHKNYLILLDILEEEIIIKTN